MRSNRTSGIPLTVGVSVSALMLLVFASGTAQAKRGCSAFGHSCFGGHGKRFDPHIRDNAFPDNEGTTSDRNQELGSVRLNNDFAIPMQKFDEQGKLLFPQTRRPDSTKINPYTLSFIFGNWLTSHRRLHQSDLDLNNE
ncbi:neuropeptide CCHamide-2 [Lasioglossum baleicum]|uniref:neuropeptide CCHamide-2 n=1 Tax=Lasioglossum baleicum TaxID=434251 RepID=UPI003FCD2CA7